MTQVSNVKHRPMKKAHRSHRKSLGSEVCPICGEDKDRIGVGRKHSYCRLCHNAYARKYRPKYHELPKIERFRSNARAYVNVLKRRGKIIADTCSKCGLTGQIELHHPDIDKRPLFVIPICRECHRLCH